MLGKLKEIVCPECEGFGKAVNYFDPPIQENYYKPSFIKSESTTSKGYSYTNYTCKLCNGLKVVKVITV